jgi:hypothetical protein
MSGREVTLAEAAEKSGLTYNTVLYRLKRGWPVVEAFGPLRRIVGG